VGDDDERAGSIHLAQVERNAVVIALISPRANVSAETA
jgi:hypothetical protein